MMPPAAISGRSVTAATWPIRGIRRCPSPVALSLANVPRWPPASEPWTQIASAPAAAAITASLGSVTVTTTRQPASDRAAITPAGGQPKVKLTSAGGSASRIAIFSSRWSSSHVGSPRDAPTASAWAASELTYPAIDSASVDGMPGTNRFTPNRSGLAARTAAISAAMAAGVL